MQPQSDFFAKLPSEVRLMIYDHILSDFRGKNKQLVGALSSCKQMNTEMENKLTRAFHQNLLCALQMIKADWSSWNDSPIQVTVTSYTKNLEHDAITVDVALPKTAFASSFGGLRCLHSSIFPLLTPFHLVCLSISFFDDAAYIPDTMWAKSEYSAVRQAFFCATYPLSYKPPVMRVREFRLDLESGLVASKWSCHSIWNGIHPYYFDKGDYEEVWEHRDGSKQVPDRFALCFTPSSPIRKILTLRMS